MFKKTQVVEATTSCGGAGYISFKLERDQMIEIDKSPYQAWRGDARIVFLEQPFQKTMTYSFVDCLGTRRTTRGDVTFGTDAAGKKFLQIGCMAFTGENYDKLRKWAYGS